jgi:hypothetical protein
MMKMFTYVSLCAALTVGGAFALSFGHCIVTGETTGSCSSLSSPALASFKVQDATPSTDASISDISSTPKAAVTETPRLTFAVDPKTTDLPYLSPSAQIQPLAAPKPASAQKSVTLTAVAATKSTPTHSASTRISSKSFDATRLEQNPAAADDVSPSFLVGVYR